MDQPHHLVAILPIKRESERVPGKNFRNLAGYPLYWYILSSLLSVREIDHVVIETDCPEEFAAYRKTSKITILSRPEHLCGHHVSMNDILAHAAREIPAQHYLQTHATNPFLTPGTIRDAIHTYLTAPNCSLFSVDLLCERFYSPSGEPINHDPAHLIPTQQLEPLYRENSCLYLFDYHVITSTGRRIGPDPTLFPTPPLESIDIDTEADWSLAVALANTNDPVADFAEP